MAAIIIDGKAVAAKMREDFHGRVNRLKERGINPCLAVVLVGENPASVSYVRGKKKALAEAGMESRDIRLPETISEEELLTVIRPLNTDDNVHGILVQFPLPAHIRTERIIEAINPVKDVDCFHLLSLGRLLQGQSGFLPCTPQGIILLLQAYNIVLSGSRAVVVGRSNIVGRPLSMLLSRKEINATVTICHTGTKDLAHHTRDAEILIVAAGCPGLIRGDMIKAGAVVIDVGTNRVPDSSKKKGYRICGDVVFEEALDVAGWITPVPGGVGPMTIAMLMQNLLLASDGSAVLPPL